MSARAPSPPADFVPAPTPRPPTYQWGSQAPLSIRTLLLYIGLSMGVLLVISGLIALFLMACTRPGHRRRQAILAALERHRQAALQATKEANLDFKPQVRARPVVVMQPGGGEVAFAASLEELLEQPQPPQPPEALEPQPSSSGSSGGAGSLPAALAEDPELGLPRTAPGEGAAPAQPSSSSSSRGAGGAGGSTVAAAERTRSDGSAASAEQQAGAGEEQVELFYNPLTHYVTERQAHYFTATVGL